MSNGMKPGTLKQEQLQLTGGGKKERRRELDFYPTPTECTLALLNHLNLKSGSLVWECACGNGAISKVLLGSGYNVISTDLFDYGYGEKGADYLQTASLADFDAIITNPPFNLSSQFIQKAVTEAPLVAMLLKSQYWHSRSRYELFQNAPPLLDPAANVATKFRTRKGQRSNNGSYVDGLGERKFYYSVQATA